MTILFGSAALLSILHAAGSSLISHPEIIGGIAGVVSNLNVSPLSKHLPEEGETLHDHIIKAHDKDLVYLHHSSNVNLSLAYDETTFTNKLSTVLTHLSKNPSETASVIHKVIKRSELASTITGTFELHEIEHEDRDVKLTTITFSPIKTDKIWNLYFTTWGSPYIDIHIQKKDFILITQENSIV